MCIARWNHYTHCEQFCAVDQNKEHNNWVAFYSASSSRSEKCLRFSTGRSARCLSTWGLSLGKQMKEGKREQRLGGITSGFPDPASWHFGLCSHHGLTCSSPTATPTSTPVTLRSLSVSSPAPRKLQWSEIEHTNYSLVVPKIANNSVCVCVCMWGESAGGPVFASALPWQPGFARERFPFFFKRFFSLRSKKTVHTGAANCSLFVMCYVIIKHPKIQVE